MMISTRLQEGFDRARTSALPGLLPYFTAGFPDAETVAQLIKRADEAGVVAVEIGFPYSDSIADGPVIQESFNSALAAGHRVEQVWQLVSQLRPTVRCGLVAMTSFSIVCRLGVSSFMSRASSAGFDGVIVPDLPVEESALVGELAAGAGLAHIGLIADTTPPDRCRAIASASSGFIYRIAAAGTTGERNTISQTCLDKTRELAAKSGIPICVGFGISTKEHVRAVCAVADGAIVGSALIRRIGESMRAGEKREVLVDRIGGFIEELMGDGARA